MQNTIIFGVLSKTDPNTGASAEHKESKHQRTVNFIPRHLIHVNHPLLPVHLHDLPFFPFKRAPDDSHLVFFSHRNRSAVVLLLQLWRQRGGHDFTPLGRRRREVRFARFSPRRGHVRVKLHRGRSVVLVRRRFLVRVSSKSFDFCVSCARKSGQFITYSSFSISLIFVPSSFRVLNALFSFPLSLSKIGKILSRCRASFLLYY